GIHDYLVKHSYANARSDDLWAALSSATGTDVSNLMDVWTRKVGSYDLYQIFTGGQVLGLLSLAACCLLAGGAV
ncbi:unnamed protein product, partial [Sphacelaria rigidula]